MQLGRIIRRHPTREGFAESVNALAAAAGPDTNCPRTWEPRNPGDAAIPMIDPPLTPRDEAIALLHATSEVEHSLMVQYLYAAYSLKDVANTDPRKSKIDLVRDLLLHIAREEMAHLATVQNLLHLLGAPLHLDREHSPFASHLLPFRFKLEPVSLGSLAKYVIAESPRPLQHDGTLTEEEIATIMGEVTDQAKASNDGVCPGHVGDILSRLIWLFKAPDNAASADKHLADDDFRANTESFQADWNDWGFDPRDKTVGGTTIKADKSLVVQFSGSTTNQLRAAAVKALEEIAEQGEGTDTETIHAAGLEGESHFEWFWLIYRTFKELVALPGDPFVHNIPVCPNTTDIPTQLAPYHKMVDAGLEAAATSGRITNERSLGWAKLFNLRYRLLLTQLHHFLRIDAGRYDATGDRTARGYLLIGVFSEMRRLKKIAAKLVQLPRGDDSDPHRAGPPFELPYTTQIPDGEAVRWKGHLDVSRASVKLVSGMLESPDDAADGFLLDLKVADEADQMVMAELAAGRALPPQTQDFPKVVRILEEAVRGFSIGAHRNVWADKALAAFKAAQGNWVTPGNAAASRLIQALEGTGSFAGRTMPRDRPPVPGNRIDYIKAWINANPPCPDSAPPYPELVRERDPSPESAAPVPPVVPPVSPPAAGPSFEEKIRPLFTPSDVSCMKAIRGFDLSKYEDVKPRANAIFEQLDGGLMPPTGRWPQADIDLFKAWMDGGLLP